jgi:hypothetical protein
LRERGGGGVHNVAKDPDSGFSARHGFSDPAICNEEKQMAEKSCAACDCELDGNAIKVTIGGHVVEVCCEECAQKLREAHAAAKAKG